MLVHFHVHVLTHEHVKTDIYLTSTHTHANTETPSGIVEEDSSLILPISTAHFMHEKTKDQKYDALCAGLLIRETPEVL